MTRPHPGEPYFKDIAARLGRSYLRYSFTKGTAQEIPFLIGELGLKPGQRVLDVGCGPGRHSIALAAEGLAVTGIDISRTFLDIAAADAAAAGVKPAFFEMDAREMPFGEEFDAVIALCQGAFGLMGDDDSLILRRMWAAAKPGAVIALTAFSSYFEAAHPRDGATFDLDSGLVHESTKVIDESGGSHDVDLWTGVYTPRELRLLAIGCGLVPEAIYGVEPGDYDARPPSIDLPELLLVARRPK